MHQTQNVKKFFTGLIRLKVNQILISNDVENQTQPDPQYDKNEKMTHGQASTTPLVMTE